MNWKFSKFDEAIGLFWGAALFFGALVTVMIGFQGNGAGDWVFAGIVGGLVFLFSGLLVQGIITLLKKDDKPPAA